MKKIRNIKYIDKSLYEVILVGITKEGNWLLADSLDSIASGQWRESKTKVVLSPDAQDKCVWIIRNENAQSVAVDVVFPVLHGLYGEDGTVQGTGHHSFTRSKEDGSLLCVYHIHNSLTEVHPRLTCISPAEFVSDPDGGDDVLVIHGPSCGKTPMP